MGIFRFKQFSVNNTASALKLGTDAVLLGASLTLRESDRHLLDIGTGTGVIALMAAQRLATLQAPQMLSGCDSPQLRTCSCHIDAIDIDGPSIEEAAENFAASPWSEWLHAYHCPLSRFDSEQSYDLIFSNPPFYDSSLRNPDEREAAARHTDSLSYREILAFAAEKLAPEGRLSMILPSDCERALLRTAASFGLRPFRIILVQTTAGKKARRIVAEFARSVDGLPSRENLILQDGGKRTQEYSELTKGFYL